MLVFGIFCATAVLGVEFVSHKTDFVNGFDGDMDFHAGRDRVITGVESHHNNKHEDRHWKFYTSGAAGMQCNPGPWTDYKNGWDGYLDWHCPGNQALNAVFSFHDNGREDRLFRFKCCDITSGGKFYIQSIHTTPYINGLDGGLDAKCNPNSVLVGLRSYHDNGREDRRWSLKCGIVQEEANPIYILPNSALTGWLNDWDSEFHYTAPGDHGGGHMALVGFNSYHDNGREDRRWRVYYASTPGVTCHLQGWTEHQNLMDGNLNFQCPRNQIVAGFGSYHDNKHEDRRYQFRCCSVEASGFHISHIRGIGEANGFDGGLDAQCAKNEVLVGAHSWHNNKHEDRIWVPYCGTLTRNPPDYDDCSEVEIIDVTVEDIKAGTRQTKNVNQYSTSFNACGNSITPGMSTLHIQSSKSVSRTTSLTLAKSLQNSFTFSSSLQTTFKWSTSVTTKVKKGIASASFTNNLEWGINAGFTTTTGRTTTSSETSMTEDGQIDVNVVSSTNTYEPAPYQWREARATYLQQDVIVPLKMNALCRRKDGRTKTLWIDSTLTAAAYSQIELTFIDRTRECPQSYYKTCECVNELKSNFITRDGCQTHPFFDGHPGCYVYKGANCGNGQGLGTSQPIATIEVCTDPARCPNAQMYIDYPLDEYVWEWSYKPCGGDQYYPGDPGYDGPQIEDTVEKIASKHCHFDSHGTLGDMSYISRVQAILACDQINRAEPGKCFGVYDPSCDNDGKYYLCSNVALQNSQNSCVWKMHNQHIPFDGVVDGTCEDTTVVNPGYMDCRASSVWGGDAIGHSHGLGRLHSSQAWSAEKNEKGEWWQIDAGRVTRIFGVLTQARVPGTWGDQRVESYKVQVSLDGNSWRAVENGRVFTANTVSDSNAIVENEFAEPVLARYVRIVVESWHVHISMRAALKVCGAGTCEERTVVNPGYTDCGASSVWGGDAIGHSHGLGRLHSDQAWSAEKNEKGEWWQIDAGDITRIVGVLTQARVPGTWGDQRVESYKVQASLDGISWRAVDDGRVFTANTVSDSNAVVENAFAEPVEARYVRIVVESWNVHISMRAALKVCGAAEKTWQKGFCTLHGADQNDGVIKVNALEGNTVEAQAICLAACEANPAATGCEVIWNQENRGCYIHTQTITEGNNVDRHLCSIFKAAGNALPPAFQAEKTWQTGFCTLHGADQNDGVIKVNALDGNTVEAQAICMAACEANPAATGCEVIWDQENRGCYIHTQAITEGNNVDRHLCSIFKAAGRRRAEKQLPKAPAGEPVDENRSRFELFVEFGADMLKTNL